MDRSTLPPEGTPQVVCRLKLAKTGPARFMSHLDFMRAVERAVRRAGLPVALTQGFHPHPRMSFSPALPVGVESECELVDVELREGLDAGEAAGRMRAALPPGLRLMACAVVPHGGPSLSSMIRAASYDVDFGCGDAGECRDAVEAAIGELLRAHAIPVSRTTPKGIKEVDLRPLIYELGFVRGHGTDSVRMLVAAGPGQHVRPGDVVREIARRAALGERARPARIVRKEFFAERNGALCPLL